jgi:lipoate-protein ligase A
MSERWRCWRSVGSAASFHARAVPDQPEPSLWIHQVEQPAVVLGSTQGDDVVDEVEAGRRGIELARRRSGGGVVLVHPDHSRWVDVIVPRHHPRWSDDVGTAFHWVGAAWSQALQRATPAELRDQVRVHRGGLVKSRWSSLVCFAGLGPGEVTIGSAKVVGISQRRTRHWARFQCLVVADPDLDVLGAVLSPAVLPGPRSELTSLPMGGPVDLDAALSAFCAAVVGPERAVEGQPPN